MSRQCDIAVVGAGIVGLATALRLAQDGHEVLLIDRDSPGRGCSYGNAGHVATESVEPLASLETLRQAPRYLADTDGPLAILPRYAPALLPWLLRFARASLPAAFRRGSAALAALQAHSLDALTSLVADADCERLLKPRGHLLAAESPTAPARLAKRRRELAALGVSSRELDRTAIDALAPGLAESITAALYFPDTAHVTDPYRLCRALLKAFEANGGSRLKAEVARLRPGRDGRYELVAEPVVSCRRVVVAAGAWSRPILRPVGLRLPLEVERGYHLTWSSHSADLRLPVASFDRHTVITPMSCGLRITGFVEFGGLAAAPEPARWRALESQLRAQLPAISLDGRSEWMGHRPSLPDHLPAIGPVPGHPSVFVACGHQHLGLTLSGITADCIAALIAGRPAPLDLRPFDPARF